MIARSCSCIDTEHEDLVNARPQSLEFELVEFGDQICRDVTRTLVDQMQVCCQNLTGKDRLPHSVPRIRAQRQSMPFAAIWEKR